MKKILGFLTRNPIMGALAGALVTAVLQSSSATTVMVIGFVSAGPVSYTHLDVYKRQHPERRRCPCGNHAARPRPAGVCRPLHPLEPVSYTHLRLY